MADTDIQTDNSGLNKMLSQNIAGLDSAIKKYIPADKEGAEKLTKQADEIKSYEDKVAFPTAKPPEKENTDPLQVMGSSAGWIATLGSLLTRHPLTSALNASAAAIGAAKEGDEQKYQAAMTKWKENDELIQKQQEWIMNKLKSAKGEDELRVQAHALGFPGVDSIFRTPGGAEKFMELYEKNWKDLHKHSGAAMNAVSEKMEKASFVRDSMEQWQKDNPKATKLELDQKRLEFQNQANKIAKGGSSANAPAYNWDSLKPDDIVPGTNSTYAEIKQKAEARHKGSSYSDLGLSTRTTKNPEKAAVDNLRAKLFPQDDLASIALEYGIKKHEASSLGSQESRLKLSDNLLRSSIPSMMAAADKIGLSRSTDWNTLVNTAKKKLSSEDFKNFQTQLRAVASDYAQFIGRGRQTVHSDEEALKILNENEGTSSLKGFSDAVNIERKNVEKGMKDTESEITGKKQPAEGIFNDGASKDYPISVPKDKKFEVGKYYDLSAEGHGVHKYLGNGEFE